MSKLNVNAIEPSTGTDITLGASGDTITVPSGATFTQSGTMNASAITAGTLAIAQGGTGAATFAAAGLEYFSTTAFSTYITSTQTPTSGVQTTLTFDAERFDLGSAFNTTTYEYTPPSTGYYVFNIAASFRGGANTNLARCNLSLQKGASTFQDWEKDFSASYVLNACTAVSIFAHVTNSDAFKVFVNITDQSGNPSVLGTTTNSYFEGWRIY